MGGVIFSIIVPVYNVEKYLEKCVNSLLEQKNIKNSIEILLIDDGSTDHSGMLCDMFAQKYASIRVFHKENGGLSSARNLGIEKAVGEYVLFVDSDDFIEENACHVLDEALKVYKDTDAAVFDGTEDFLEQQTTMRRIPVESIRCTEDGKTFLLEHYRDRNLNVEACLYVYRRQFLLENQLKFQEGILHEDVEFTPRALLACGRIIEIPDRLYHYMIRENSISTQKNREKNIRDLFKTLELQCQLAEEQEPELRRWMKNAALNSYLNMIQEARMYQEKYRKFVDKRFLLGKAATNWNRFRVMICLVNVRLYCWMNDFYKRVRKGRNNAN